MKNVLIVALLLAINACAVAPQYPNKRTMTSEGLNSLQSVKATIVDNNHGIGMSWFATDSSAAGAQYGLLGGLVSGIMDAIINSGPSGRAQKAAEELATAVSTDEMNDALVKAFQSAAVELSNGSTNILFDDVSRVVTLTDSNSTDTLKIGLSSTLSQEGSQLRINATGTYTNNNIVYKSPYDFKGKQVPKSLLSGPIYYNTFTFYSDTLPIPVLTPEIKAELVSQIKERYTDANGNLPAAKTDDRKKYDREMKDATDGDFSKSEMSIFLIRSWVADDAKLLKNTLNEANKFFAKHILSDFTRNKFPAMTDVDETLETLENGRVVTIKGNGIISGSIESRPGKVDEFSSWGNSTQYAKENLKRTKELSRQNQSTTKKKSKRSKTSKKKS